MSTPPGLEQPSCPQSGLWASPRASYPWHSKEILTCYKSQGLKDSRVLDLCSPHSLPQTPSKGGCHPGVPWLEPGLHCDHPHGTEYSVPLRRKKACFAPQEHPATVEWAVGRGMSLSLKEPWLHQVDWVPGGHMAEVLTQCSEHSWENMGSGVKQNLVQNLSLSLKSCKIYARY